MNTENSPTEMAGPNSAAMAPSSGEPNGVNYPIPSHTASVPTFGAERGNPNGTKPEQLYYFENKVSQNLAHEVEVAEAMYQIYFRKLFTETGLPYYAYIKAKWDISRSRAYQLLHYARRIAQARAEGKSPPTNERAARNQDRDGKPKSRGESYASRLDRVQRHIKVTLTKLPPDEQRKLLIDVNRFLNELGRTLPIQQHKSNPGSLASAPQTSGSSLTSKTHPVPQTPVTPSPATQIPAVVGKIGIQTPLPSAAPVSPAPVPPALPATSDEDPNPFIPVNSSGVSTYTMEQARVLFRLNGK